MRTKLPEKLDAIEAAANALAPFINCNDAIHREAARAALLAAADILEETERDVREIAAKFAPPKE